MIAIRVPLVAQIYKKVSHWVDRTNQMSAYYNSEFRSVRKQNRLLDYLIETYALVNGHTLWINTPHTFS